jgi:ribosomal protein L15E
MGGVAAFQSNRKLGYMDKKGEVIAPPSLESRYFQLNRGQLRRTAGAIASLQRIITYEWAI